MIDFNNSCISQLAVHFVGNKTNNEPLTISDKLLDNSDAMVTSMLQKYFLKPFTNAEFHAFTFSNGDATLNAIYNFASTMFDKASSFQKQTTNIATQLHEIAVHPQIKSGDLFVAYFTGMCIDNVTMDAIGIFKSENRQSFLKVEQFSNEFSIHCDDGINIDKLDKGCLIFNTDKENGYKVCVVDNTNKTSDAQYWKDDFLNLRPCNDEYHNTKDYLNLAKTFFSKQLPNEYEVTKTAQIDLLNRSLQYFQNEDEFDMQDFNNKVIQDPQVIESFNNYRQDYQEKNNIELNDSFEISGAAVKKQTRAFKSVLKLDKNFHVYIHGNKNLFEQGVEKDGRKYYKLYFEEEN